MNLLIFDYDGVIVDSFEIFMENFILACQKEGVNEIANKEDFLKLFEGNMYESMIKKGMSRERILRIVYAMRDAMIKNQEKLKLFDGIAEAIKKLSTKNKLAVVTSNETAIVKKFLKDRDIDYFEEIIGSDREASKVKKIKRLKEEFPSYECYYIGDTVGDIIEGRRAGAKTAAVTWGWHSESKLREASPDYIVHSPKELADAFRKAKTKISEV